MFDENYEEKGTGIKHTDLPCLSIVWECWYDTLVFLTTRLSFYNQKVLSVTRMVTRDVYSSPLHCI